MKDEDIGKLLRDLPRHKASAGFTHRLMERLPNERASAHQWWRPAMAMATAVVVVLAASTAWDHWQKAREQAEAARRVEALRTEYESLERELEELRSLAAESQPVLNLGGTGEVDFVMDLRALSQEAASSQARPVNYRK